MKILLAAAAFVLVSAGASLAQTAGGACGDVVNDANATCPSVLAPSAGGSVNSGLPTNNGGSITNPGSAIDGGTTNAVQGSSGSTTVPGSAGATGNTNANTPYSNQGVSRGGSGISSPSVN